MEALSVREYRNNLAASFTKADNGEQVLIRRKNEIYALVKVGREDLMITRSCKQGLTRQGKKSNPESVLPSKAVRILTLISIVYDVHN